MSPEEADRRYKEEWPALNKEFEITKLSGDRRAIKALRQQLTALSIAYSARHELYKLGDYLKDDYPTLEELINEATDEINAQ